MEQSLLLEICSQIKSFRGCSLISSPDHVRKGSICWWSVEKCQPAQALSLHNPRVRNICGFPHVVQAAHDRPCRQQCWRMHDCLPVRHGYSCTRTSCVFRGPLPVHLAATRARPVHLCKLSALRFPAFPLLCCVGPHRTRDMLVLCLHTHELLLLFRIAACQSHGHARHLCKVSEPQLLCRVPPHARSDPTAGMDGDHDLLAQHRRFGPRPRRSRRPGVPRPVRRLPRRMLRVLVPLLGVQARHLPHEEQGDHPRGEEVHRPHLLRLIGPGERV